MTTTVIQYSPQNSIVSTCLDFLSTLKGVKILPEAELPKTGVCQGRLSAQKEKELFFAGSRQSMSKHLERYL